MTRTLVLAFVLLALPALAQSIGGGGVSKIVAGTNITVSPTNGIGQVTVNGAASTPVSSITGLATGVLNFLENGAGTLPAQTGATQASAGKVGELANAQVNGETIAVTLTNASPTVVTMTGNTFAARCIAQTGVICVLPIYFTSLTGTSGVSNLTQYFVDPASISGSTFKIATTIANALAGTDVNTTGTDSGTGVANGYITTTNTPQSIMALSLTPGDWDCSLQSTFIDVTSNVPTLIGSAVSASLNALNGFSQARLTTTFVTGSAVQTLGTKATQELLSGQTTIFGNISEAWTGGANPTAAGELHCRRMQ